MPIIKHLTQPDLPGMPRYFSIFGHGIRGDYLAEKQIDLFDSAPPPASGIVRKTPEESET